MVYLEKIKTWVANHPLISQLTLGTFLAWVVKEIGIDLLISPMSDKIKSLVSQRLGDNVIEMVGFYVGNVILLSIAIGLVFLAFQLGKHQINGATDSASHLSRFDLDWTLSITIFAATLLIIFLIFDRLDHDELKTSDIADGYWEPLTSRESDDLSNKLSAIESVPIIISCSQQSCRALTRSLVDTFKSASWNNIQSSVGGIDSIGVEGITIYPIDDTARSLRKLIEESTSLNVQLTGGERNSNSYPATYISIGSKPL